MDECKNTNCSENVKGFCRSEHKRTATGLSDKNNDLIYTGDTVRLIVDGEKRDFKVCYKTVKRTVVSHPDFDSKTVDVYITGIVFTWNGYDLFPMMDKNGVSDVRRMKIIRRF